MEYFVGEGEVADDGVVVALVAGLVGADVVRGPAGAEGVALGGELADEVGEVAVVWVAAGFGAQHRDGVVGDAVPLDEEAGRARVEEDEAGVVGRLAGREVHLGVQRVAELIGGQHVSASVLHQRGRVGHRVDDALHARPDPLRGGAAASRGRRWPGGAGEIEEVCAFGVVEAEAAGESIEHAIGDAAQVAAFHLGVVVDADSGEHRGFLAAQPGDAAGAAEDREAGLLRRELRSARREELSDLVLGVHGNRS